MPCLHGGLFLLASNESNTLVVCSGGLRKRLLNSWCAPADCEMRLLKPQCAPRGLRMRPLNS
eukprot:1434398-Alexandrium_andersonii.AAC.1